MPVTMTDTKSAVGADTLDAVEKHIHMLFPQSYREWLLKFNGGSPTPNCFRYKLETGPYTDSLVEWFFAIHDGQFNNFEHEFLTYKVHRRRLPDSLVGIAHDPFGNLLCLSFGGQDQGKVYLWDHEEERAEPTYDNCHLIADSFDEFIDCLY